MYADSLPVDICHAVPCLLEDRAGPEPVFSALVYARPEVPVGIEMTVGMVTAGSAELSSVPLLRSEFASALKTFSMLAHTDNIAILCQRVANARAS